MRHFCIVEGVPEIGECVVLSAEESRHLSQVLRARPGMEVGLRNGRGYLGLARITAIHRSALEVEVLDSRILPRPAVRITLAQASVRGAALDSVLKKAVELGAYAVTLFDSERAVAPLKGQDKPDRWDRIMQAAMKQCGNPWLPEVHVRPTLQAWLDTHDPSQPVLFCDLQPNAISAVRKLITLASTGVASLSIVIGPEGDFSPQERQTLTSAGAIPISLGEVILRSEAAAGLALGLAVRILSDYPSA